MSRLRRRLPLPCRDVVELITEYLEDSIPADERAWIDRHLGGCPGCTRALRQFRLVIDTTGRLGDADVEGLDGPTRVELIAAFERARDA